MKWIASSEFYDIDTGEKINYKDRKHYIIIKKERYAEQHKTIRHIKYANICRRKPEQTELFKTNT